MLIVDRSGMRRVWLRRRENVQKRYLIHVAGYNLGLIMRLLTGAGTPRQFHVRACLGLLLTWATEGTLVATIFVVCDDQLAAFAAMIRTESSRLKWRFLSAVLERPIEAR